MDDNGTVGAVLAALAVGVSPVPVWQASDGEVTGLVVATERAMRALAGVQLAAVAEGLTRGLAGEAGAGSGSGAPGRWVRSLISITPGEAARRADLAGALFTGFTGPGAGDHAGDGDGDEAGGLGPTRQAVLAGVISTAHAGQVVSALARLVPPCTPAGLIDEATLAEAQALLLGAASGDQTHAGLDPTQVAKAGIALTATLDPTAGERLAKDEDRQHQARALCLVKESTGMWWAQGHLVAEVGQRLFDVVQSLSAPRPAADGTPDPRSAQMRAHDGLGQAMTLLQTTPGALTASHGSPNRLVISVTTQTLTQHLTPHPRAGPRTTGSPTQPTTPAELPGRWPLSPLSAQVMACDADLVAVLTGPDGTPLDVADTIYQFPTRQRTAIIDRDRHCTYPTCTAPPDWCHIHHLHPYSRGGPTATTNAALLCGTHHRYVHAHHLTGHLTAGQITWQPPTATHNPHQPPIAIQKAITTLAQRWHQRQTQQHRDTG